MLLAVCVAGLTTGCRTYEEKNRVIGYWRAGDVNRAAKEATARATASAGGRNAIIWQLEQGATLRATGEYAASNQAFEQAAAGMDDFAQRARVRVGQEALALLSNPANLAYEGRAYDGIMLNTYRALNFLALGKIDRARPELIRAGQRQQAAVEDNARRIARIQSEAAQSQNRALIDRAAADPAFQANVRNSLSSVNDVKAYADYVNPFTVYLDGIYFMANSTGPSDLERARFSLQRAAGFVPDNDYVRQDLAALNGRLNRTAAPAPVTYVIFETGRAPLRNQVRIDIPIFFSRVSFIGAAFPVLQPQGDFLNRLSATADGQRYDTQFLASMDGMIALDFRNEMPVIITRTIATAVARAVGAYVINDQARRQGNVAGFFVQLATAAYQMSVNIADTRTWTTLPKEFQICRFPTPADGRVVLAAPLGGRVTVTLDRPKNDLTPSGSQANLNRGSAAPVNVIYVRSIATGASLLVSQFRLK